MSNLILLSKSWSDFERTIGWYRFKYWVKENIGIIILIVIVIIGFIVIAVKLGNSNKRHYYNSSENDAKLKRIAEEEERKRLLAEGGWECQECGVVNPKQQKRCICGQLQSENNVKIQAQKTDDIKNQIEAYKKMLDDGLITQEEFEAKKKTILNI